MKSTKTQELLLNLMPMWNYQIAKPFKQLLDEGVSLEMYYCIQMLRWQGGTMTMSQLARQTKMPKQQMTKLVNRLVEQRLVSRTDDLLDRRVINIQLTKEGLEYMDHFLENEGSFSGFLDKLDEEQKEKFRKALEIMFEVFLQTSGDIDPPLVSPEAAKR